MVDRYRRGIHVPEMYLWEGYDGEERIGLGEGTICVALGGWMGRRGWFRLGKPMNQATRGEIIITSCGDII